LRRLLSCNPKVDPTRGDPECRRAARFRTFRFKEPIGAARCGTSRPSKCSTTAKQLKEKPLNSVIRRHRAAVMMVEIEAHELDEDIMPGSVGFRHRANEAAIQAIHELADEAAKPHGTGKPRRMTRRSKAHHGPRPKSALGPAFALRQKQGVPEDD